MRYKVSLIVVTMSLLVGIFGGSSTAFAQGQVRFRPLEPQCDISVESPHWSSGANSVIAKARFYCDSGRTATYNVDRFNLYNCPTLACDNPRYYSNTSIGTVKVASGQTETRYVPPTGARFADGPGSWYAKIYYSYPGSSTQYSRKSGFVNGPLH